MEWLSICFVASDFIAIEKLSFNMLFKNGQNVRHIRWNYCYAREWKYIHWKYCYAWEWDHTSLPLEWSWWISGHLRLSESIIWSYMLEIKSYATRCVEFVELTKESLVHVCIDARVLVHHRRSLCTRRAGKERCGRCFWSPPSNC